MCWDKDRPLSKCTEAPTRNCAIHGPALRKGPPWFEKARPPFGGPGLSPPLPSPGMRWAQVLKAAMRSIPKTQADIIRGIKWLKGASKKDELAAYVLQISRLLDVDLSELDPRAY